MRIYDTPPTLLTDDSVTVLSCRKSLLAAVNKYDLRCLLNAEVDCSAVVLLGSEIDINCGIFG